MLTCSVRTFALIVIAAASLAYATLPHARDCDSDTRICASGSPWYTLGASEVRTHFGDAEASATITLMTQNDLRVRYRMKSPKETNEGELLLVGGRVLALKGGNVKEGYEIDYLDGAALTMQTAVSLLHVAIPEGPKGVQGKRRISVREPKRRIDVATQSASANYGAPWTLEGSANRLSPESIGFELKLVYMPLDPFGRKTDGKAQTIRLSGKVDYPAQRAVLADDFSLSGWKVLGLGPQQSQSGNTTKYDYGAGAYPGAPRTVGDVRAGIRQEAHPGEPDPSMDFAGFWKEKCEDNFGLDIARVGSSGMYSVSFCGPGGCFEPGTYRPNTFINKDRSYQVVSATEIRILGGDGWSTYRKCGSKPAARRK